MQAVGGAVELNHDLSKSKPYVLGAPGGLGRLSV